MIFISDEDVRRHVPFAAVLAAVERAFVSLDRGESEIFEVVRGHGSGKDHFFGIKSGRDGSIPALGLKAGSYAPENHARGMPSHTSTTLLIDDLSGRPFAVVEANYLNGMRTAAADALAVRELAREDSTTLGIIGTGGQAVFDALAVAHVRPIRRILAVGSSPERRREFESAVRGKIDVAIEFVSAQAAARECDVLVTVTPARAPVIMSEWVRAGTHISAMGADNVGKQELDVRIIARADLWVDHAEQSARIGEMQHAVREGVLTVEQLRARTLGRLLRKPGSFVRHTDTITVFDSSGLAVQDIAAAHAAMQCVKEARDVASSA